MISLKETHQKPRSRIVTITLSLAILTILLLHHPRTVTLSPTLLLNPCGRIVLVTAARHGSTWFISSAEGCTAKDSSTFGNLNSETELWVDHDTELKDMTPARAAEYVRYNKSLKIMPLAYRRELELREFFRRIGDAVPVFVLRRDVADCYASLVEAKQTGMWMRNKVDAGERGVRNFVTDVKFERYRWKVEKFFKRVVAVMKDSGNVWDQVDYEDVSLQRVIVGRRNRCFIRNCNFL